MYFLAIDTTEQKKVSLDHEFQIVALNKSNIKVDFLPREQADKDHGCGWPQRLRDSASRVFYEEGL